MASQGSLAAHNAVHEKAARAADRSRITDVEAQILELERCLSALKEERSLLQDRLATYAYPVLTLPNEIVSEIFIHFLPEYPKRPPPIGLLSPYLLCHICRQWRDIAFATPALWRAVSLSLMKSGRLPQKLRYLSISLGRSGSCLLSLKLRSYDSSKLAHFGQMIIDHCARWEYLEFHGGASGNYLPDIKLPLPFLRSFKGWGFLEGLTVAPLAAPSLRHLFLGVYYDPYSPIFPWSQLTVVCMRRITLDQYSYLVNQLVNVVTCRLGVDPVGELSLRDVTLSHLETFVAETWVYGRSMPSGIFEKLTLPALRRLQIHEKFFPAEEDPVTSLASLFTRSKCTLRELSVLGAGIVPQKYRDGFPSASIRFSQVLDDLDPFLGLIQEVDEDLDSSEYSDADCEDSDTVTDSEDEADSDEGSSD